MVPPWIAPGSSPYDPGIGLPPVLHHLRLRNVGPTPKLELTLAPRLNLITGDNGLGKSFLLDAAWYCLTRRWPQELNPGLSSGAMALPRLRAEEAELAFRVDGDQQQQKDYSCSFNLEEEAWIGKAGRPVNPGLVLYAMADGAFAVWDPARNAWHHKGPIDTPEKTKAYVFSNREVWKGLANPNSERGWLCNGLVRDWAGWQRENGEAFAQLKRVLAVLSSDPEVPLQPGPLVRLRRDDALDYPTLQSRSGPPVPVVHASAGVRRILALAYLLVWAWQEHLRASELLVRPPARQMIVLVDEVEAHLHPTWQRRVVKALMQVVQGLNQQTAVQLLLVTHSPLVMASVEPLFDPEQDSWWDLDWNEDEQQVVLTQRPFDRLGDANSWLRSEAFDQSDTGSLEREEALQQARRLIQQGESAEPQEVERVQQRLQQVLGGTDVFWTRWRLAEQQAGWRQ